MQSDHVGLPEQLPHRNSIRCWLFGTRTGGDQYFHTESSCHLRDGPANITMANDAKLFPLKLDTRKRKQGEYRASLPRVGPHRRTVTSGLCCKFQDERQSELCHRLGCIPRNIAKANSELLGRLAINDICAGGGDGDEFQLFCRS